MPTCPDVLKILCVCSLAALISMVFLSGSSIGETSVEKHAIIIVSSYGAPDAHEVEKADDLYGHLIEDGYSPDNIDFLTPYNIAGSTGISHVDDVEASFDRIVDNSNSKEVVIYVSDHSKRTLSLGDVVFQFDDGDISTSTIDSWIDDMVYNDITIIVGGDRSGLAGPELFETGRVVMSSMDYDEVVDEDQFDIARSLNDPDADADGDGEVTFTEAFDNEVTLLASSDQTPRIWE